MKFTFECPSCGQHISATTEDIGIRCICPACSKSFKVPAPDVSNDEYKEFIPPTPSQTEDSKKTSQKAVTRQSNPLLLPVIALTVLLLIVIVGAVFYIGRRSNQPQAVVISTTPTPVVSTPIPKPIISEDTKSRVLGFIEKASKLKALTDQGLHYNLFCEQLAEVKGSWDTLTIGWPEEWVDEKDTFQLAIEGWDDAKSLWENKIKMDSKNNKEISPLGNPLIDSTIILLRPHYESYASKAAAKLNDTGIGHQMQNSFDMLDKHLHQPNEVEEALQGNIDYQNILIKWSLTVSSHLFEKGRDEVKSRIENPHDPK